MLAWLAEWPALLSAVFVVFGPGLLIGAAMRVRGLALWALAPALGVATLTASAVILGLVGVGWTPLSALLSLVVIALVVFVVRHALRLTPTPARQPRSWSLALMWAGIATGIVLVTLRVGAEIGEPAAISQTNDAAFHLNALRFAVETGHASPLVISNVTGASSVYPSGWHVLTALIPQLSGASVEVAANMSTLVLSATVWPIGIAYLTRIVAGPIAAAIAAAMSSSIAAFPLLLVQWGVLYPQLLAVALLPAALGVVVALRTLMATPLAEGEPRWGLVVRAVVLCALPAAAIVAAQPSVILAWAVALCAASVWALVSQWRQLTLRRRLLALAGLAGSGLLTILVWWVFGRSVGVGWPTTAGRGTAVLETVVNGFLGYPWAVVTSALMLVGIVAAVWTPRLRWVATTWAIAGLLYIVAVSVGSPLLRRLLVGPWYEDPYRLAALVPVFALPLAGAGAASIAAWAQRGTRRFGERASDSAIVPWVGVALVAVFGIISFAASPQIARRDVFAHTTDPNMYTVSAQSFLSVDELALLRRLDETVPEDATVIGNPGTGMAFGYAISGRDVIPRTWSPPAGADYAVLWESLRDVATEPAVCDALDTFDARYVLDFGPGEEYPGRWLMPGFTGLADQPGFELVDREGTASLWRVTACE